MPTPENVTYAAFWSAKVSREPNQRIRVNADNALLIFRYDPRWNKVFGYNQFERRVFVREPPPKAFEDDKAYSDWSRERPLSDADIVFAMTWLQGNAGLFTINTEMTLQAIMRSAEQNPYHPVLEQLDRLPPWDSVPRINTWITETFGCESSRYHTEVGRKFLIGMIARIKQPGSKMDYMLVLEGEQGLRKSTVCQVLAGGTGFGVAQFKSLDSPDTSLFLRNKWVIEFGEMHALRKAEVNELKLWLVREIEDYRPKWGRVNAVEPRQCVFIGTSNGSQWLNDPTGGRRFWPIRCIKADVEWLQANREQLLAEAIAAHATGELPFPDPEVEKQFFVPEQKARMVSDPWESAILPRLKKMNEVAQSTLFRWLGMMDSQVDNIKASRVDSIMLSNGWTKIRKSTGQHYRSPTYSEELEAKRAARNAPPAGSAPKAS